MKGIAIKHTKISKILIIIKLFMELGNKILFNFVINFLDWYALPESIIVFLLFFDLIIFAL